MQSWRINSNDGRPCHQGGEDSWGANSFRPRETIVRSRARPAKQYFLMRSPGIIKTQLVCAWRSRLDKSTARCALPSDSLPPGGCVISCRLVHAPATRSCPCNEIVSIWSCGSADRTPPRPFDVCPATCRLSSSLRRNRCELAERVGEAKVSASLSA